MRAKAARALRERRTDAREFGQNTYAVEEWLRKRLDQKPSPATEQRTRSERITVEEKRGF
jgi:hypothetical protein